MSLHKEDYKKAVVTAWGQILAWGNTHTFFAGMIVGAFLTLIIKWVFF